MLTRGVADSTSRHPKKRILHYLEQHSFGPLGPHIF